MRYYPIHLDLRGRLVAVIGGGAVAQEKVEGLLDAGARVKVIAPSLTAELARLAAEGAVVYVPRAYQDGDLEGAFLAVGERLGAAIDGAVWREAEARGIPCNVQDDPAHCSFIAASIVRRGDLTVTVSTSGKAPALAVRLRQQLERQLGAHYARFLEIAGRLREPLAERLPDFAARRDVWYRLVDSDVLELLGRGEDERARERVAMITGVAADALAEARPPRGGSGGRHGPLGGDRGGGSAMTWSPFPAQPPLTPAAAASPVPGTVYLVGAGPGDPDLMTVRGLRCLRRAGVVLYDRLVHPSLLDEAPAGARRIFVGKARGRPGLGQAAIHRLLIEHARRGQVVVRLKGGDPFVFGRGSEEAEALAGAGVPWEVVPAASSAFAVPALAGIPLTHRRLARGFAVVTGHQAAGGRQPDWAALAAIDTVVVLMGLAELATIAARLVEHGRDPATPAAVIARGTLPDERVVVARLDEIALRTAEQDVPSPATLVVGEVVGLREVLREKSPPAPLFQRGGPEAEWAASPLATGA